MDHLYERLLRPLLFRIEPERAHEYARNLLQNASRLRPVCAWLSRRCRAGEGVDLLGVHFPNRVGLAAGMDKDAEFVLGSAACGFGHVEVGTVTPEAQPGQPQPRMFRLPEHEALINRMGFNNKGAEAMRVRLERLPAPGHRPVPVGINIGKNKNTPLEEAGRDYERCFRQLADLADYFAVNVSSPNTEGLRQLQESERLRASLEGVQQANAARGARRLPVLLKISPDLSFAEAEELLATVEAMDIDGLIVANTTVDRGMLPEGEWERGGLSGKPLLQRSTDLLRFVHRATGGRLPLIGVGGVVDAATAEAKLEAGASLVQVYTGWVYRGPFFPRSLARALRHHDKALLPR
jgi:dihydroorotate dehydrogenase